MIYDVLVIGAGVTGTLIARELTKYEVKVCFVDKGPDAASASSRANSGILHAGFDAKIGTLKAKLNVRGCAMMKDLTRDLDVAYKNTPSLVICLSDDDRCTLEELYERGIKNGVPDLRIIEKEELRKIEPNVSEDAVAALYAPSAGIVSPYELAIAAGENAVQNGADYHFEFEVKNITQENDYIVVSDGNRCICAKYVVCACGIRSDEIAEMTQDKDFDIIPRKGEYMLFDKNCAGIINNVLFPLPTKKGKGILVAPTADGNLLVGPNANVVEKDDTETTTVGLDEIHKGALSLVPSLPPLKNVITSFAGLRATPSTGDFIIKKSKTVSNLLHLAGIESPGLASSPAIAEYVVQKLSEMGLDLTENKKFEPTRPKVTRIRELSDNEIEEKIKNDPSYGKIVCRCETITEGEIIDAIRRPMGARSVDAVKRRTRAGMGRCQGGFCMPRVTEILARELGRDLSDITKFGKESKLLFGKIK